MNKNLCNIRDGKSAKHDEKEENDEDVDVDDQDVSVLFESEPTTSAAAMNDDIVSSQQSDIVSSQQSLSNNMNRITQNRVKAKKKQTEQAETMLKKNKKLIDSFKIDDLVLLHVDDLDIGAADAPNLVCVILEKKDDCFKLGHKSGVLKEHFPFHVLTKIEEKASINFSRSDVPLDQIGITIREAVKFVSIAHGQGVKACNCLKGTCGKGTKCSCFNNESGRLKCNSKCHKGQVNAKCTNK